MVLGPLATRPPPPRYGRSNKRDVGLAPGGCSGEDDRRGWRVGSAAFSTVTPNALARIPDVTGGSTRVAVPPHQDEMSVGAQGALPFAGIIQSS